MKLKIKKGDTVKVISGADKGKSGRVLLVMPDKMRVLVEGINIRTRAQRPTQANPKGGLTKKEIPIHYSNVMLVDKEGNVTRVGINRVAEGGKSVRKRVAKTTQELL